MTAGTVRVADAIASLHARHPGPPAEEFFGSAE